MNPQTWRLTNIRTAKVQMQMEESGEVVPGIQFHLSFLDREPSKLITKNGDRGHKHVQFAIPNGVRAEQLYDLFRQLPEAIESHLNPERINGKSKEAEEDPEGEGGLRLVGSDAPEQSE